MPVNFKTKLGPFDRAYRTCIKILFFLRNELPAELWTFKIFNCVIFAYVHFHFDKTRSIISSIKQEASYRIAREWQIISQENDKFWLTTEIVIENIETSIIKLVIWVVNVHQFLILLSDSVWKNFWNINSWSKSAIFLFDDNSAMLIFDGCGFNSHEGRTFF